MIDHTGIGVSDMGGAARFYDAVLETLGLRRVMAMAGGADGIGLASTIPYFGSIAFTPTARVSTPPSQQ
jgi:catechol 2,3-dioxygenase-like lactoylglutathione lyase family enzyme